AIFTKPRSTIDVDALLHLNLMRCGNGRTELTSREMAGWHSETRRGPDFPTCGANSIVEHRPIEIAGGDRPEQHARQGGTGQVALFCLAVECSEHRRWHVRNDRVAIFARLPNAIA